MDPEPEFERARNRMVDYQIAARGVNDVRVLAAMREIPRHLFVPQAYRPSAYEDRPLPIGEGQTISQPFIVGWMTALLELGPADRVLEIGTGSGYQAAILARLAKSVISIERLSAVAEQARTNLARVGVSNVEIVVEDGTMGYPPGAPYNGIIVTAATPEIPDPLVDQLAVEGRLVAPVGPRDIQQLVKLVKRREGVDRINYGGVAFVPLIGRYGWKS